MAKTSTIEDLRAELLRGPLCVVSAKAQPIDVKSLSPGEIAEIVNFMRERLFGRGLTLSDIDVIKRYRDDHTGRDPFTEYVY